MTLDKPNTNKVFKSSSTISRGVKTVKSVFTNDEREILDKINDSKLYRSLELIKEAMKNINRDTPTIVEGFTDHGEKHCVRLIEWVKKILYLNNGRELTQNEVYLLFAGIYLHDIGMKCDILKYPEILSKAKDLGANFDNLHFIAKDLKSLSKEEQKAIRKNHHYLTAAWISYASITGKTILANAMEDIDPDLIEDLSDICKFHSQLSLDDCSNYSLFNKNDRKRLVAAILRFADELDIKEDNVSFEKIKDVYDNPIDSIYWWLHHCLTKVSFINNLVHLSVRLNPSDVSMGSVIYDICIKKFDQKNRDILYILSEERIPIIIDYHSGVIQKEVYKKLPDAVTEELKKIWWDSSVSLDEIEKTYERSVYGYRSTHFRQEKIILAKKVIDQINLYLSANPSMKYCLVIDSGTTTYHVFSQICQEMKDLEKRKVWRERIVIVTNNLPGFQNLMINCRENPSNEHSEVALNCLFLPGKPLQPYVAVASEETVRWMSKLNRYLSKQWGLDESKYEVISIISSSYAVPYNEENASNNEGYYPVARETWHVNIKKEFITRSNKVFFIAPLLKFSFARVEMLNQILGFKDNIKYIRIFIPKEKCVIFTTSRNEKSYFSNFSCELISELKDLYVKENIVTEEFGVIEHTHSLDQELEIEIPHENLRAKYNEGINIWNRDYITAHEQEFLINEKSKMGNYKGNHIPKSKRITNSSFKYDIFICHSSKDKLVITSLIEYLKKEQITYWIDAEQINFGDMITQKIEDGLKKSKYVVPCISKNSNKSGWTRAEYGSILNEEFSGKSKRTVIPLKLDNCRDNSIPLLLKNKKRVTYSKKEEFEEFIKYIKEKK